VAKYVSLPIPITIILLLISVIGCLGKHTQQISLAIISLLIGYFVSAYIFTVPDNHISRLFINEKGNTQTEYISQDQRWQAYTFTNLSLYHPNISQKAKAIIINEPQKTHNNQYKCTLRLISLADIPTTGNITLFTSKPNLKYGDVIESYLQLTQPRATNPGQVDYHKINTHSGIYATASEYSPITVLENRGAFVKMTVYAIKNWLRARYKPLSERPRAMALAMVLGDRQSLEAFGEDFYSDILSYSGIMHLFAVSGLHMGIIAMILTLAFSLLRIPSKINKTLIIMILVVYILILNGSPPIVRAGILIMFFIVAQWAGRMVNTWQIVLMTLFLITIIYPNSLFSASLLFSFLAFSGIILSSEIYQRVLPIYRQYLDLKGYKNVVVTRVIPLFIIYVFALTCIQIMILPATIYYFEMINLNSFFANLICVPLFSLLLPLYFIILFFPFPWFYTITELLSSLFYYLIRFFGSFPFVYKCYQRPLLLIIMQILLFVGLCLVAYSKRKYYGWLLCLLSLLLLIPLPKMNDFQMIFFDVGNGDACLIRFSKNDYMVIDTAEFDKNYKDISKNMVRYLKEERVNSINKVLLTHNHSDHYGGIFYLAENIAIDTLIVTDAFMMSEAGAKLQDKLRNTHFFVIDDTLTYKIANYNLQFLHPSAGYFSSNENNNSIVCKLTYSGVSILFTGDIERVVENKLVREYPSLLKSDIIKTAHHGSQTSSQYSFISAVNPEVIIISGSNNPNNMLTSDKTLDMATELVKRTYQTGRDGAVIVKLIIDNV